MNIKDAWIKPIARPLLRKVVHMCSDYFTEDSCGKHQELKQRLLGGNLNYLILNLNCLVLTLLASILKPDVVSFLSHRSGSYSVHLFTCSKLSGNKNIYDWVRF